MIKEPIESSIYAVVVHHKSLATVAETLRDLQDGGIGESNLILVDNSEDSGTTGLLRTMSEGRATLLTTVNRGYAAAVNVGIRHASARADGQDFLVLVATHEVRIPRSTLQAMISHLTGKRRRRCRRPDAL